MFCRIGRIALGESASAFLQSAGNQNNSPAASTESARGIRAKWLAPGAEDVVALVAGLSRPGGNVAGVTCEAGTTAGAARSIATHALLCELVALRGWYRSSSSPAVNASAAAAAVAARRAQ